MKTFSVVIAIVCTLALADAADKAKDVLSHESCRYLRLHRYCVHLFINDDLCNATCNCKDVLSEKSCKILKDQGKCDKEEFANDCKLTCDKCSVGAESTGGEKSTAIPTSLVPCNIAPLGMENNAIPIPKIAASSYYSLATITGPSQARLNQNTYGWIPKQLKVGEWLQVDLGKPTKVTAIATQGSKKKPFWMETYKLKYSLDGSTFTDYEGGKVFDANKDQNTVAKANLDPPINARYIRVYPQSWNQRPAVRMELYGC